MHHLQFQAPIRYEKVIGNIFTMRVLNQNQLDLENDPEINDLSKDPKYLIFWLS